MTSAFGQGLNMFGFFHTVAGPIFGASEMGSI